MALPAMPSDLTVLFQSFTHARPIAEDVRDFEGMVDETRIERFRYPSLDTTTRVLICCPRAATIRRRRASLPLGKGVKYCPRCPQHVQLVRRG